MCNREGVCVCVPAGSGLRCQQRARKNVCVFLCLITVVPCACVCTYANIHVMWKKDEPMCSAKFEYYFRVCGYVKANVYVIVRDLDAMLEQGKGQ